MLELETLKSNKKQDKFKNIFKVSDSSIHVYFLMHAVLNFAKSGCVQKVEKFIILLLIVL